MWAYVAEGGGDWMESVLDDGAIVKLELYWMPPQSRSKIAAPSTRIAESTQEMFRTTAGSLKSSRQSRYIII
jgi:hypothetical protein